MCYDDGFNEQMFNITGDMNVGQVDVKRASVRPQACDPTQWLSQRLPLDLPTVDKDLLILMAAYYGDIDRYERLRRPSMIH